MLREEEVVVRAPPPEGQRPSVAGRGEKTSRNERLPEVGVVHDVPHRPLAAHVRHPPVHPHAVADRLLVLAHRLRGGSDVPAVRRREDGCVLRLAAELVHGVGGLPPVRVHEAPLDPHRRTVVSEVFAPEDLARQLLETLGKTSFEAVSRKLHLQRHVRVGEREEAPVLVGPLAVVDYASREVVVPRGDAVEEHRLLDVDERRQVRRRDGDAEPRVSVYARRDSVERQLLLGAQVLRQRLVLVLRPERGLVGELQVHRVLHGGELVVVEPRGPRDKRALVHLRSVAAVELGRLKERPLLAQLVGAQVGVLVPQRLVLREPVHHAAPLAVPLGVLRAVEHLLGHVAGADHGAGHHARDLAARPREAEDVARQHADALPRLLGRSRRLARLRVVHDDELGTDRAPVGALVLHAANASRYPGDADYRSGGSRARDCRKHDLARRPRDARPLALVELSGAAVRDPLQTRNRIDHLREVLGEVLVHLKLGLDRVEHLEGRALARTDDDDELAVSVGHRPDSGGLRERGLARAASHRESEEPAFEDGLLQFLDCAKVVVRPFEVVHFREVGLAELPEVEAARLLPLRVDHGGKLADVAPREREVGLPLRRRLAVRLVCVRVRLSRLRGRVAPVDEPRRVAVEAEAPRVLGRGDAVARLGEVAVHHRGGDDRAKLRGVEEPHHLHGLHLPNVDRHRPSPLRPTRCTSGCRPSRPR